MIDLSCLFCEPRKKNKTTNNRVIVSSTHQTTEEKKDYTNEDIFRIYV